MNQENDGVEWAQGLGWMPINGRQVVATDWLPPLYPHRWYVQRGVWAGWQPQMRIALRPRRSAKPFEFWEPTLAKGTWSEVWPVLLAYVEMIGE